ncbi:MAG: indole-3-glycerol-phosphate synthase [Candidatus Anstonellales archaeon]
MGFLEEIIPKVKESVDSGYYVHLREEKRKSFVESIEEEKERGVVPIIAEVKPFSPTQGRLIKKEEMKRYAQEFVRGGACALSILTEPKIFEGDILLLQEKWAVPVLMKDFVIDRRQIGSGDCVLLIQRLLDLCRLDADEFISYAHEDKIEVLLEVHNVEEFERAKKTEADIIGINNRDLATMEVDINTTIKILEKTKSDRIVVSESGINSPTDVKRLIDAGADAILVGTGLLVGRDIRKKIYELKMAASK